MLFWGKPKITKSGQYWLVEWHTMPGTGRPSTKVAYGKLWSEALAFALDGPWLR